MKILNIRWLRLVNDSGRTCPRCDDTGGAMESACAKLQRALAEIGVLVELRKETLDFSLFQRDPLQSNRVWLNGRPMEDWLGATVGASQCCDVCGDAECRTLATGQGEFEAVPEHLIIRAGLLAAAELFDHRPEPGQAGQGSE